MFLTIKKQIMSPLEKVPRLKFNIHSFFDIL